MHITARFTFIYVFIRSSNISLSYTLSRLIWIKLPLICYSHFLKHALQVKLCREMRNCRKLLNSWWTYYLFWAFITECHNREVVDSNKNISHFCRKSSPACWNLDRKFENFPLSKLNECLSTLFSCYDSLDMQIGRCLLVIQLKQSDLHKK